MQVHMQYVFTCIFEHDDGGVYLCYVLSNWCINSLCVWLVCYIIAYVYYLQVWDTEKYFVTA